MYKSKLLNLLDYLPLVAFLGYLTHFIVTAEEIEYLFSWQHYLAIFLFILNIFLFYKNHKLGVIFLAFTIILGICRIISCKIGVERTFIGFNGNIDIPIGQTFFWNWLFIHFALSFRHYFAIATKNYWKELLNINK